MKKTPLRRQSKKRALFNALYKKQLRDDLKVQECAWCGATRHKDLLDPHHPFGKVNERILAYIYLCRSCHDTVHDFGKASELKGWLQPEFRSMKCLRERVIPWAIECEANWPDNLKRTTP